MMPVKEPPVPPKQPATRAGVVPDAAAYDEERTPFAEVMRKLANTKPPHKAVAKGPTQRNASKPPKRG